MNNKFLKIIVLCACAILLLSFTACKDDNANDDTTSINSDLSSIVDSADPDRDNNNDVSDTSSGVELEEDVFDNADNNQSSSSNNSSSNTTSTSTPSDNTIGGNQSTDNASDDSASEDNTSEDVTSEKDGTIKLPPDWFD